MRLKYKISFAAAVLLAVAVSFASCLKDVEMAGDKGNGGLKSDKEKFISLNIGIQDAEAATRAFDGVPTSSENWVNNVCMVLYEGLQTTDSEGRTIPDPEAEVLYVYDFLICSKSTDNDLLGNPIISGYEPDPYMDGAWEYELYGKEQQLAPDGESPVESSKTADKFVTFARPVKDRDYYMLILINIPTYDPGSVMRSAPPPLNLRAQIAKGMKLKDFLQPVKMDREVFYNSSSSVLCHLNFFMSNANGLVFVPSQDLADSEVEAHGSPIQTEVERAVAKVLVTKEADLIPATTPDAKVGAAMRFDIVNSNKWLYWMRKQTNMLTTSGAPGAHEIVSQPIPWSNRNMVYAEDPNFSGYSELTSSKRSEQFDLITDLYPDGYTDFMGNWTVAEKDEDPANIDYAYTLENTMVADEQDAGMIPTVYLSVEYTPNDTYITLGDSYFVFNEVAITIADMQAYAQTPGSITDPALSQLADAIESLEKDASRGIKIANITNDSQPFRNYYGIDFYRHGINYYKVPIINYGFPSAINDLNAYGKYGVVRNGMYHINITAVKGPGSPTLTDPAFISAEINILRWGLHDSQKVDVGKGVGDLNKKPSVGYYYYYEYWGVAEMNEPIPTRAGPIHEGGKNLRVGWHIRFIRSYYRRMDAGLPIPYDTQTDLNRFKLSIPEPNDNYKDGEAYGWYDGMMMFDEAPPSTVSVNALENKSYIIYWQHKGQLNIRMFDIDTNEELTDYVAGYLPNGYLEETYPADMVVDKDTYCASLSDPYSGIKSYADIVIYHYTTNLPYTFHSMTPVTVVQDMETPVNIYYKRAEMDIELFYAVKDADGSIIISKTYDNPTAIVKSSEDIASVIDNIAASITLPAGKHISSVDFTDDYYYNSIEPINWNVGETTGVLLDTYINANPYIIQWEYGYYESHPTITITFNLSTTP